MADQFLTLISNFHLTTIYYICSEQDPETQVIEKSLLSNARTLKMRIGMSVNILGP